MKIEVYYYKKMNMTYTTLTAESFPFVSMSKTTLRNNYVKLPIVFFERSKDEVFDKLNIDTNPMGTTKMQNWIRDHGLHHTSMSTGDIVNAAGTFYLCLGEGWAKIEWVS